MRTPDYFQKQIESGKEQGHISDAAVQAGHRIVFADNDIAVTEATSLTAMITDEHGRPQEVITGSQVARYERAGVEKYPTPLRLAFQKLLIHHGAVLGVKGIETVTLPGSQGEVSHATWGILASRLPETIQVVKDARRQTKRYAPGFRLSKDERRESLAYLKAVQESRQLLS